MTVAHTVALKFPFRLATPDDAPALVDFVDYAGSGMPMIVWATLAGPGKDARAVGLGMARGQVAPISYRNAIVADTGAGAIGTVIGHTLPTAPQPIGEGAHAITVPWQELRNEACGNWHLVALAAYPEHRGRGLGSQMLGIADCLRQASGADGISLLVADSNTGARRLYERFGFRQAASRPMAKGSWTNPGDEWLLLIRRG
jgi:ribosomal protein S18 acetylase RimI-like enzyme